MTVAHAGEHDIGRRRQLLLEFRPGGPVAHEHEPGARVALSHSGALTGAGLASAMWFSLLGFGAAAAAPRLRSPATWRVVDALIALLMTGLGLQLLLQPL